jgi:hypothetical protein
MFVGEHERATSPYSNRIVIMKGATISHVAITVKTQAKYFMVRDLLSQNLSLKYLAASFHLTEILHMRTS